MAVDYKCPRCLSSLPSSPPATCANCGNSFTGELINPTAKTLNPDRPAWGFKPAIVLWLMSVLLIISASFPAIIAWSAWMKFSGHPMVEKAKMEDNPLLAIFFVSSTFLAQLITLALSYRFITRTSKGKFFEALGWHWPEHFRLLQTVVLGIGIFFATAIVSNLLPNSKTDMQKFLDISLSVRIMIGIVAIIGAPFVEELIYRGILFSGFRKDFGLWPAVIAVSVLFLAVHIPQYWGAWGILLSLGFLSLTLTLVRAYSGSLLPSFVIHLMFNSIQVIFIIAEGISKKLPR